MQINEVDNVGRTSLIKGTVMYSLDNNGPIISSGFQTRFTEGGKFQAVENLSNLWLGFLKDIQHPIFKGEITIYTRNSHDYALYRQNNVDNRIPVKGKIIIDEFLIRNPTMEYNEIYKIKLIEELKHLFKTSNSL